jgi:predicted nucleotidyltransferase
MERRTFGGADGETPGSAARAMRHPESWEDVGDDIKRIVLDASDRVAELVRTAFVGAYLHGSLAMGCFYRPKSDIDLLFVVEGKLSPADRRAIAKSLVAQSDQLPIVGDIEASVVRRADALHFQHPLPYEVHYGENWKQRIREDDVDWAADRTDPDLAVHCTVVAQRGRRLLGAPIEEVFGPVPVEFYRGSVLEDLDYILEDDHLSESPYYGVLNCCRVLELEREGWDHVVSKEEGAQWALANLPPDHHALIEQALRCYRSPNPVTPAERRTGGESWDLDAILAWRQFVADQRVGNDTNR